MKILSIRNFAIVLLGLCAGIARAQGDLEPKELVIDGKTAGLPKASKVVLAKTIATGGAMKIDSTTTGADGSFVLKTKETDRGTFYTLTIAENQRVVLLSEGGETLQVFAANNTKPAVTGSKNMEYYAKVDALMQDFSGKVAKWNEEYIAAEAKKDTKTIQRIQTEYAKADHIRTDEIRKLVPEMGTSLVALWSVNNFLTPEQDLAVLKKLAADYEKVTPTPTIAKGFIGQVKRMAGLAVGDQAPDFTLDDPSGKPLALSSLKGQYVLIDFWASWCGPCRQENPNVVKTYAKYKDKGFSIYGVSLDKDAVAWKKAIEKDGLTWLHGSDLKYWNSTVAQSYGVTAIPATYLLDKEGKIIAKGLRGASLEAKLQELFGQ